MCLCFRCVVSICLNITQFGIAVVYLLLSSKNIHDFVQWASGTDFNDCYVILCVALGLLPVTFLKSPADFWYASRMISTSFLELIVLLQKPDSSRPRIRPSRASMRPSSARMRPSWARMRPFWARRSHPGLGYAHRGPGCAHLEPGCSYPGLGYAHTGLGCAHPGLERAHPWPGCAHPRARMARTVSVLQ